MMWGALKAELVLGLLTGKPHREAVICVGFKDCSVFVDHYASSSSARSNRDIAMPAGGSEAKGLAFLNT